MGNNSWKAGLLSLFLGAPGQFLARLIWLNGSMDKPWLFAFFPPVIFPPYILPWVQLVYLVISGVGSIWYFFDWVEMGEGSHPVDANAWLLPLLITAFTFIFLNVCDIEDVLAYWLITMTSVIFYALARYMKRTDMCASDQRNMNEALWKSFIVNSCVPVANVVAEGLSYIPMVGMPFKAWGALDFIPGLQNGATLGIANIIENMMANTPDKQKEFCENDTNMWTWYWWTMCFVVCLIGACIGCMKDMMP